MCVLFYWKMIADFKLFSTAKPVSIEENMQNFSMNQYFLLTPAAKKQELLPTAHKLQAKIE